MPDESAASIAKRRTIVKVVDGAFLALVSFGSFALSRIGERMSDVSAGDIVGVSTAVLAAITLVLVRRRFRRLAASATLPASPLPTAPLGAEPSAQYLQGVRLVIDRWDNGRADFQLLVFNGSLDMIETDRVTLWSLQIGSYAISFDSTFLAVEYMLRPRTVTLLSFGIKLSSNDIRTLVRGVTPSSHPRTSPEATARLSGQLGWSRSGKRMVMPIEAVNPAPHLNITPTVVRELIERGELSES